MKIGRFKSFGFVILFSIFILFQNNCAEEEKPEVIRPVKSIVVGLKGSDGNRRFAAKVDAVQNVELSFQVPGKVTKFAIKEGQQMKKGDLIAQLDAADFEQELTKQKAIRDKAKADQERYRQLWSKDAVPLAELQSKERNFETAEANYQIALKKVNDTKLFAPFDGQLSKKYVEENQEVQAKQPIVQFQDLSKIQFKIDVPEVVMSKAKKGGESSFEAVFETQPDKKFPLTIYEFSATADPKTRTFEVTLTMPATDQINIFPGMTATVHADLGFEKDETSTQFSIPVSAVFTDPDGKKSVWIVDEQAKVVKKRSIKAGQMRGDQIFILEGLKDGDRIVTAGTHVLQEDMKIRLLDEKVKTD